MTQQLHPDLPDIGRVVVPGEPEWPTWATSYHAVKRLDDDGHWLALIPLFPLPPENVPRSRVAVCTADAPGEHWCYADDLTALIAFVGYPDPPEHWTRHVYIDDHGHMAQEWPT